MIPVKHETKTTGFPAVSILIILACTAMYCVGKRLIAVQGFVPLDFMYGVFHPAKGLQDAAAACVASLFMHGSSLHLLSNMWYLWLFGPAIERRIGWWQFALSYGAGGIIASLSQAMSSPLSSLPIVGASGAIAAIMGLTLIMLPRGRLICYFPPLFFFKIPSFVFLLLWFGIQYINLYLSTPQSALVAWWAHIGGFLFGVASGAIRVLAGARKGRRRKKA
jgi:membrane associated rhomboid family serine protease